MISKWIQHVFYQAFSPTGCNKKLISSEQNLLLIHRVEKENHVKKQEPGAQPRVAKNFEFCKC